MKCDFDFDEYAPELFREAVRKAKKTYHCAECKAEILPGSKYELASGKWDGEFAVERSCLVCAEIRKRLFTSWEYGALRDMVQACADDIGPADIDGLSDDAVRKIEVWMEMQP